IRKIHPPGGEVKGFGETAPGVIEDATKGAHRPIVSQGGAEERLALFGGEVEAPPKRIIEISGVTHNEPGYKNSVTIARPTRAEVVTQTMTAPRRRVSQMRRFAPVWGGECCSLGFSLSRHRPGKGGTPIEPATLASVVATLFSRKRLKKREKADKSASDFTANLAHVDRKRKQ